MSLQNLALAQKAIAQFPGWSEPEDETGYCWFNAPLAITGVIEQGFVLHGGYLKEVYDANVTFELNFTIPGQRKRCPIARIDWKALRGGHSNPKRSGIAVSGQRVSDSHHHAFDLNWVESESRMRFGNLPMAEDIPQEIQSFESLLPFVGKSFRINNIDVVTPPKWEYTLFDHG